MAVGLFAFAFIFRMFGITWGLPNDLRNQSLHPDEMVVYRNFAYRPNPLLPNNYNYPTLYPVLLRVAGDMVATYGGFESPLALDPPITTRQIKAAQLRIKPHQRAVNLTGRILSSAAGAGLAVVVFLLSLRVSGRGGAVFGGLLTAIAPSLVVHSRFQTVDVTAAFFFWLSIYFALRAYSEEQQQTKLALLAGVFAGLSAGTKYTGVLALLSVLVALGLARRPGWPKAFTYSVAACAAVFCITTPGALLDNAEFMRGLASESAHMKEGHDLAFVDTPPGFLYQLGNLFTGIGPLAAVVGILGFCYAALKARPWALIALPAVLFSFLLVASSEVKFVRYGLPIAPAVCVGFGYAIAGIRRRPQFKYGGLALGLVAVLGLESAVAGNLRPSRYWASFDPRFGGLYGSAKLTAYMMGEDPRDEAAQYVIDKTAKEPKAAVGLFRVPWFWTVPVFPDAEMLYNVPSAQYEESQVRYLSTVANPLVVFAYMDPPPPLAVLTSLEEEPFLRIRPGAKMTKQWKERYESLKPVFDSLRRDYETERAFGDDIPAVEDLQVIHPRAEVLRRKG